MLLNLPHFAYFTTPYDIISLRLVLDLDIFAWLIIYMDSLRFIFMISTADLSVARSQEPKFMLHNSISCRNIGND